jgi:3-hydroxyisobutyrate dehydrogenase-like beta-hydroxyacid dehydrogenase
MKAKGIAIMKVGIIGIGTMGKPMAANILKAGHTLSIFARNPEKARALEAQEAKVVASPAEVAAASDFIVLSLPFDPEVEEVVLGSRGIAEGAKPGLLILDTTTGSTKAAVQVAERLRPRGIAYLDAPVSGGVKGAVEGTMTFLVGGEGKDVERATSLMNCLGGHIHHLGPVGAGRGLKALVQIIAAMNTLTLCEAVVLGKRLGIEPTRFYEALSDTAANSYHLQTKLPQFIIPGTFDTGHRIEMMVKDLEIGLQMGREMNNSMLVSSFATQLYRAAATAGYAKKDISAMANFFGSFVGIDFTAPPDK